MINVFITDDHPAIIDAIKTYLSDDKDISVVGEAINGKQAIEALLKIKADVLLLDYSMPEMDGLDVCAYVEEHFPDIKIIVITNYKEASLIKRFLKMGAVGYLTKDATKNEYINAIKDVVLGGKAYSPSIRELLIKFRNESDKFEPTKLEREVLLHMVNGLNTEQIADKLCRSTFTIEERRKKMLDRFRMHEGDDKNMNSLIYYVTKNRLL